MKEIIGNIWDYHKGDDYIVIPTNGTIKKNGELVMGRGLALQAKLRYPELPLFLGKLVSDFGNHLFRLDQYKLLSFPVKDNWWEVASLELIEESTKQLAGSIGLASGIRGNIYLPRVGCGNGKLSWSQVKSILEKCLLDDRFIVVSL